jgi:diacylglycerol O-acyltransferase / wax synthase
VLSKLHHCLADDVSGAQLHAALLAATPPPTEEPAWHAEPPPSTGALVQDAVGRLATNPVRLLTHALRAPEALAGRVSDTVAGLTRMASVLAPAAPSSLSGPIGSPRRYAVVRASLPAMRAVAAAFCATVNDVALTAITLAFREILLHRGEQPNTDTLRALAPVSVHGTDTLDNQVSLLLPTLPMEISDPATALREVHRRLTDLKHSKEPEAGASARGHGCCLHRASSCRVAPASRNARLLVRAGSNLRLGTAAVRTTGGSRSRRTRRRRIARGWERAPDPLGAAGGGNQRSMST